MVRLRRGRGDDSDGGGGRWQRWRSSPQQLWSSPSRSAAMWKALIRGATPQAARSGGGAQRPARGGWGQAQRCGDCPNYLASANFHAGNFSRQQSQSSNSKSLVNVSQTIFAPQLRGSMRE